MKIIAQAPGNYQIPFREGHQLEYPMGSYGVGVDWRDNFIFEDTLTYFDYVTGRSAIRFYFRGADEVTYSAGIAAMNDIIPLMCRGKVTAQFTFRKQGQNYGIVLAK